MDESSNDPYSSAQPIQGDAAVNLDTGTVKLTDLASCGGCAAKYSAARLEQLLAGFVPAEAEDLLVGLASGPIFLAEVGHPVTSHDATITAQSFDVS